MANRNGRNQCPLVAVPPESLRNANGCVGCLKNSSAPMIIVTQTISAITPMLLSRAATLTPATLITVPSTISPSAQGSASVAFSNVTPNQPAMNGAMDTATVVTATVCAMSSHHPVCQASHGRPVMRQVI